MKIQSIVLGSALVVLTATLDVSASDFVIDFENTKPSLQGEELKLAIKNEIKKSSGGFASLDWWARLDCGRAKTTDSDSYTGKSALLVTYPTGKIANDSEGLCDGSGTQFQVKVNNPNRLLFSHYVVKLKEGFSFGSDPGHEVMKLPGIASEGSNSTVCSGKNKCSFNNYSYRLSIRNSDKYAMNEDSDYGGGSLFTYAYDSTTKCDAGDYIDLNKPTGEAISLKADGNWHTVDAVLKLNDFDPLTGKPLANGMIQIFFDGNLVLHNNKMTTLGDINSTQAVDVFYFSTFFGGADDPKTQIVEYSPQVDSFALFDDVRAGSSDVISRSVATFDSNTQELILPVDLETGKKVNVYLLKNPTSGRLTVSSKTSTANKTAFNKLISDSKNIDLTVLELNAGKPSKTTVERISSKNGELSTSSIQDLTYRSEFANRRLCFR